MKFFSSSDKPKTINQVVLLPVTIIRPSPHQPRRIFQPKELDTLARSIAQNGLLTPISVRPDGQNGYFLIAGERRLLACRKLGMAEIPAIISNCGDTDAAVLTMVENIHREGLDFFEEAEGIAALMQATGYPQNRICALLDMAQSTLANKLRLLRLPESVRQSARQFHLSERMARSLLALPSESLQLHACNFIASQNLNSAQTEKYIRALLTGLAKKPEPITSVQIPRLSSEPRPVPLLEETAEICAPTTVDSAPVSAEPSDATPEHPAETAEIEEPSIEPPPAQEVSAAASGKEKREAIGYLRDSRLLLSTIEKAVDEIRRSGIRVETNRSDEESCFCYLIRIPKSKLAENAEPIIPVRYG